MAGVKSIEEGTALPEKRKPDVPNSITKTVDEKIEEDDDKADSNKKRKIEYDEINGKSENISAVTEEQVEEDDDDDEEDDGDEDEEEEEEDVDRKGKGIMIDTKGKGKMVEEDDSDNEDDDESSDDDSDSNFSDGLDGSELEDDPLAEVDLDNILPSRTRQRGSQQQRGLRISGDQDKGPNA